VIMEDTNEDSLILFGERTRSLELIFKGDRNNVSYSHPIREQIQDIGKALDRFFQQYEEIKNFMIKYENLKSMIEAPEIITLDINTKRAIILAGEEGLLDTAKQLEFVKEKRKIC